METQVSNTSAAAPADRIEQVMRRAAEWLLAIVFGLLPIFFVPTIVTPVEYTKMFWIIGGLAIAGMLFSLAVLRSGQIRFRLPLAVGALWGVVLTAGISALLSGDRFDAFVGNSMEVHTVAFLAVLASTVSLLLLSNMSKSAVVRVYMLLGASALVLAVYHILRLIFGTGFLGFGLFNSAAATPYGGWNSLGLFFGLTILFSMVALEQLPLTRPGRIFFGLVSVLSLIMLMVVNFFAIWVVLAAVSLMVLMYSLVKDRFREPTMSREQTSGVSVLSLVIAGTVALVSLFAILGGNLFSSTIAEVTNVSFVEVRPSIGATADIARGALTENALLGAGPNRFADAWRTYKDPSINATPFWSSDFSSGYSYFSTNVVSLGLLGSIFWVIFLGGVLYLGLRLLLRGSSGDTLWYFIGTSSLTAAVYLWGMSFVYTPNAGTLILAAFFTGTLFAAYNALRPDRLWTFSVAENKRATILLVGGVMLFLVSSVSILYGTSRHYASVVVFNEALVSFGQTDTILDEVEAKIAQAFDLAGNDIYARQIAEYEFSKLSALLNTEEPTEMEQREFERATARAVQAAEQAIASDPTSPRNWLVAGAIYSTLAGVGVESADERASAAFTRAQELDPQNPLYYLFEAQLANRIGDTAGARSSLDRALELKPDYAEALSFLTELDILEGNVDDAIARTRSIISLDPQNPGRYYQLGVLYVANDEPGSAIGAFQQAITLDSQFANARFLLARVHIDQGNIPAALEQLRVVAELNPDNQGVADLIAALEAGEVPAALDVAADDVAIPSDNETSDTPVTAEGDTETPLVSPVNVVGGDDSTESTSPDADDVNTSTE